MNCKPGDLAVVIDAYREPGRREVEDRQFCASAYGWVWVDKAMPWDIVAYEIAP